MESTRRRSGRKVLDVGDGLNCRPGWRKTRSLVAGAEAWLLRGSDFLEIGSQLPPRLTNVLRAPVRIKCGANKLDEFIALELPLWREVADLELPTGVSLPIVEEGSAVVFLKSGGFVAATPCGASVQLRRSTAFLPGSDPEKLFAWRDATDANRLLRAQSRG